MLPIWPCPAERLACRPLAAARPLQAPRTDCDGQPESQASTMSVNRATSAKVLVVVQAPFDGVLAPQPSMADMTTKQYGHVSQPMWFSCALVHIFIYPSIPRGWSLSWVFSLQCAPLFILKIQSETTTWHKNESCRPLCGRLRGRYTAAGPAIHRRNRTGGA